MKKFTFSALAALVAIGISAKENKTLTVTTNPKMHCSSCENKIKGSLRFEKGVKLVETDLNNQVVKITYDADKNNEGALMKSFERIKYSAQKVNPDSLNMGCH